MTLLLFLFSKNYTVDPLFAHFDRENFVQTCSCNSEQITDALFSISEIHPCKPKKSAASSEQSHSLQDTHLSSSTEAASSDSEYPAGSFRKSFVPNAKYSAIVDVDRVLSQTKTGRKAQYIYDSLEAKESLCLMGCSCVLSLDLIMNLDSLIKLNLDSLCILFWITVFTCLSWTRLIPSNTEHGTQSLGESFASSSKDSPAVNRGRKFVHSSTGRKIRGKTNETADLCCLTICLCIMGSYTVSVQSLWFQSLLTYFYINEFTSPLHTIIHLTIDRNSLLNCTPVSDLRLDTLQLALGLLDSTKVWLCVCNGFSFVASLAGYWSFTPSMAVSLVAICFIFFVKHMQGVISLDTIATSKANRKLKIVLEDYMTVAEAMVT